MPAMSTRRSGVRKTGHRARSGADHSNISVPLVSIGLSQAGSWARRTPASQVLRLFSQKM